MEISKTEIINSYVLDNMRKNENCNQSLLYKYFPTKINNTQILVYTLDKKYEKFNLGRLYCDTPYNKQIHNALLVDNYISIKIKDLYVRLLIEFADLLRYPVPLLKDYLTNKEIILNNINKDKKQAKYLFLRQCVGGYDFLTNGKNINVETNNWNYLNLLKNEVDGLANICYKLHGGRYYEVLKNDNCDKSHTLLYLIITTAEREKLLKLMYFIENKYEVGRLFHNKIFVKTAELIDLDPSIYKVSKIKSSYSIISQDFLNIAIEKFINLMGDNLLLDKYDNIYYFDNTNGKFIRNDFTIFMNYIKSMIGKLIFGGKDYADTRNLYMRIFDNLIYNLKKYKDKIDYMEKNKTNGIGKLLYKNGYYDFKENTFIKGFNNKIIFFDSISYDFPENRPSEQIMEDLKNILAKSGYNVDATNEMSDYFIKTITMALYGDFNRKKIYVISSSFEYENHIFKNYIKYTFESFVNIDFASDNLKEKSFNGGKDYVKYLQWLKDICNKRLVLTDPYSNKNKTYNLNLIKKLTSNSDTEILNMSTFFIYDNNIKINNNECYYKSVEIIDHKINPNQNENYNDIENRLKTEEYRNALIYLIIDTYNSMKYEEKRENGIITIPKVVGIDINNIQNIKLNNVFNKYFQVTGNNNDKIICTEIILKMKEFYMLEEHIEINEKKLNAFLTNKLGKSRTVRLVINNINKIVKCRLNVIYRR